jgi:fatty-acyl-CoA synthase
VSDTVVQGFQPSAALEAERLALWHTPRASTLVQMIEGAARHADIVAIQLLAQRDAPRPITWGAIAMTARRQAAALRDSGIARGESVLVVTPTDEAFLTAFFGALYVGAVPVPVAPPATTKIERLASYAEHLTGILRDARARVVLTTDRLAPTLGALLASEPVTVAVADGSGEREMEPVYPSPQDLAFLQYTSGSTSRPKGVQITHANVMANAEMIAGAIGTPHSVTVSWLPLFHDMGLVGGLLTPLYTRTSLVLMPPSAFVKQPAIWLQAISDFGATITLAPNFAYALTARVATDAELEGVSLETLRVALNGAEPIDQSALHAFETRFARFGLRRNVVLPVYGLAEATLAVTFETVGERHTCEVDADALEEQSVARSGGARVRSLLSVGRALPQQQVAIADGNGALLEDNRVGEVVLRGPSITRGYSGRPEETARSLRGGWLHTGDAGFLREGRLYLVGRRADLIIRHGRNYYPQDLEHVAGRIDGVSRGSVAAFAVPGEETDVLVIVAESRARDAVQAAEIGRRIRAACHDAFLFGPDQVRLVAPGAIPRTTSGKVRRRECSRLFTAGAFDEGFSV